MVTQTHHLHTPNAQRADVGGTLDPQQTAAPKARLDTHYQSATSQVVPHVWNAVMSIVTVGLVALFVAMFASEWRLTVGHSLVAVLAFAAVVLQLRHLRRDRVLTQERDSARGLMQTLNVMDGSRPAPRGHSRIFK